MLTIALNGFGRIGRNFVRGLFADKQALKELKLAVINIGPAKLDMVAHMFKYDSILGPFNGTVQLEGDTLYINQTPIKIIAELDPKKIDWKSYAIDWVVDATGKFTDAEKAKMHLASGAQNVLITAPAKNEDIAIVPGVNEQSFNRQKDHIVSLGSCTTNAFVPMAKVLDDAFGIQAGFMTTIHAYTNTQVLLDVESSDPRRSRAAALNIIPTTTGASKMLGKILPQLDGKISANAIRVPTAKVSLIDLSFQAKKPITAQAINDAFFKVAKSSMKGIVDLTMEQLVSSDYSCNPYSVVIDGLLTSVQSDLGKVFGWYDNEWAYSLRLKDFLMYVNSL